MIRRSGFLLAMAGLAMNVWAQNPAPQAAGTGATLRVTSRAVLVDVLVTDKKGNPVTGLKQDAFSVTEQGKPQAITYFQEHTAKPLTPVQLPKLPPNVFTNLSPYPFPPAVNVVLLDSLNTTMGNQSWVHEQSLKFLQNSKPGSQTAIFTMGLRLHFIQGFTSDPAELVAALKNKKNLEVQQSEMLKGQNETNMQQNLLSAMSSSVPSGGPTPVSAASPVSITGLAQFISENDESNAYDRYFLTLENLQRMAIYLNSFPGRKNVIWFAENVPGALLVPGSQAIAENPRLDVEMRKTMAALAAARVALYPVDARGLAGNQLYEAQTALPNTTAPSELLGATAPVAAGAPGGGGMLASALTDEDERRNADQNNMKLMADETGGRAFVNTNGLGQVIDKITAASDDFYTISYAPTNNRMDGSYRKIAVKVNGGKYELSYRRGYFAVDQGRPGEALETRDQALRAMATGSGGKVDPLLPFMNLGMPESDQILYEAKVQPLPAATTGPDKGKMRYGVDFAIDQKDLKLKLDPDGVRRGVLNVTLLVYDRYGNVIDHWEHLAALNVNPIAYAAFKVAGLQLHADVTTPKGNFWLRTGVYDENSRKVGTLEIPLAAVTPVAVAAAGASH